MESFFPPPPSDDSSQRLYRGLEAGLQKLRQYSASPKKAEIESTSAAEKRSSDAVDDSTMQEKMLFHLPLIQVTFQIETDSSPSPTFQNVKGQAFVTTKRLFFLSSLDIAHDLAIDSCCITLHAMTCEPEIGVYCQLSYSAGFIGNSEETAEIHFFPINDTGKVQVKELCQELFDSLSRLASLNPVHGEENDAGGLAAMMGMMAASGEYPALDGGFDDMVCQIDPKQITNLLDDGNTGGATTLERQAMLERLDNVLTVPSEHEATVYNGGVSGQFDDADEDQDELL